MKRTVPESSSLLIGKQEIMLESNQIKTGKNISVCSSRKHVFSSSSESFWLGDRQLCNSCFSEAIVHGCCSYEGPAKGLDFYFCVIVIWAVIDYKIEYNPFRQSVRVSFGSSHVRSGVKYPFENGRVAAAYAGCVCRLFGLPARFVGDSHRRYWKTSGKNDIDLLKILSRLSSCLLTPSLPRLRQASSGQSLKVRKMSFSAIPHARIVL